MDRLKVSVTCGDAINVNGLPIAVRVGGLVITKLNDLILVCAAFGSLFGHRPVRFVGFNLNSRGTFCLPTVMKACEVTILYGKIIIPIITVLY